MKLVVEELIDSLSQEFNTPTKKTVKAIRPWLYKHLSPSGNLNVVVKQNGETIATSETVTSAYIEENSDATSLNYFHGHVLFNFSDPFIIRAGDFTVELVSDSYSFSESAYFGWVKPHENKYINEDYTPVDQVQNSFGLEIWEYRNRL